MLQLGKNGQLCNSTDSLHRITDVKYNRGVIRVTRVRQTPKLAVISPRKSASHTSSEENIAFHRSIQSDTLQQSSYNSIHTSSSPKIAPLNGSTQTNDFEQTEPSQSRTEQSYIIKCIQRCRSLTQLSRVLSNQSASFSYIHVQVLMTRAVAISSDQQHSNARERASARRLLDEVADLLQQHLWDCKGQAVAMFLHGFARLSYKHDLIPLSHHDKVLVDDLLHLLSDDWYSLEPAHLTSVVCALALLQHRPERSWLQAYLRVTASRMPAYNAKLVSSTFWALARMGTRPNESWLSAFFTHTCSMLRSSTARDLSLMLWALARSNCKVGASDMATDLMVSQMEQVDRRGLGDEPAGTRHAHLTSQNGKHMEEDTVEEDAPHVDTWQRHSADFRTDSQTQSTSQNGKHVEEDAPHVDTQQRHDADFRTNIQTQFRQQNGRPADEFSALGPGPGQGKGGSSLYDAVHSSLDAEREERETQVHTEEVGLLGKDGASGREGLHQRTRLDMLLSASLSAEAARRHTASRLQMDGSMHRPANIAEQHQQQGHHYEIAEQQYPQQGRHYETHDSAANGHDWLDPAVLAETESGSELGAMSDLYLGTSHTYEAASQHLHLHVDRHDGGLSVVHVVRGRVSLPPAWRQAFLRACYSKAGFIGPQAMSNIMWALATMQWRVYPQWLDRLLTRTVSQLGEWSPQQLSTVLWACSKMEYEPPQSWLEAHYKASHDLFAVYEPRQLSSTLYSLAKLSLPPPQPWLTHFTSTICLSLRAFQPQALANLIWAWSRLGLPKDDTLLHHVSSQSWSMLPQFKPQELAMLMLALVRVGHTPGQPWMAAAAGRVHELVEELNVQDVSNVLFAMASWRFQPDQGLMSALLQLISNQGASMNLPQKADLMWALSQLKWDRQPTSLLLMFQHFIAEEAPLLRMPERIRCVAAMMDLGLTPPADLLACLWIDARDEMQSLTPAELALLATCSARLTTRHDASWWHEYDTRFVHLLPHMPAPQCEAVLNSWLQLGRVLPSHLLDSVERYITTGMHRMSGVEFVALQTCLQELRGLAGLEGSVDGGTLVGDGCPVDGMRDMSLEEALQVVDEMCQQSRQQSMQQSQQQSMQQSMQRSGGGLNGVRERNGPAVGQAGGVSVSGSIGGGLNGVRERNGPVVGQGGGASVSGSIGGGLNGVKERNGPAVGRGGVGSVSSSSSRDQEVYDTLRWVDEGILSSGVGMQGKMNSGVATGCESSSLAAAPQHEQQGTMSSGLTSILSWDSGQGKGVSSADASGGSVTSGGQSIRSTDASTWNIRSQFQRRNGNSINSSGVSGSILSLADASSGTLSKGEVSSRSDRSADASSGSLGPASALNVDACDVWDPVATRFPVIPSATCEHTDLVQDTLKSDMLLGSVSGCRHDDADREGMHLLSHAGHCNDARVLTRGVCRNQDRSRQTTGCTNVLHPTEQLSHTNVARQRGKPGVLAYQLAAGLNVEGLCLQQIAKLAGDGGSKPGCVNVDHDL